MKKMIVALCLFGTIFSAQAREDQSGCTRINLGIVVIWSGQVVITNDVTGEVTYRSCGSSNGKWVWFWE